MKRKISHGLRSWKNQKTRKPLVLQGARQVGKTYCLKEFGKNMFSTYHYFDFMENPELGTIFEQDLKPERIIRDLSILTGTDIDIKKDLIILDEIQQCSKALTSLKYFSEKMPGSYIAASGSLLGLGLGDQSFPVGKISRLTLYPMDFEEFLKAFKEEKLLELMEKLSLDDNIVEPIHQKFWTYFKYFMITGGLPEVVKTLILNIDSPSKAFDMVRTLQSGLIKDYLDDIAKHSGKIKSVKIEAVFKTVPIQLARETDGVQKFVFKDVLPSNSRYANLEAPIEWLIKAGLVIKVPICNNAELPLKAYAEKKRFKLYMFDVGILGAMLDLSPKAIFLYDYGSYKGYFAENIVLSELTSRWNTAIYSWCSNNSEIEYLMEYEGEIIPIEVKAGINTKAKSLKVYKEKYGSTTSLMLTGKSLISKNSGSVFLPLYLAPRFDQFI